MIYLISRFFFCKYFFFWPAVHLPEFIFLFLFFPASSLTASTTTRPSSLHGLKHKHKLGVKTKTLQSPSRRKSVGHIPLSPLARTPSPSPIPPISPTRSPSPLALPLGKFSISRKKSYNFFFVK